MNNNIANNEEVNADELFSLLLGDAFPQEEEVLPEVEEVVVPEVTIPAPGAEVIEIGNPDEVDYNTDLDIAAAEIDETPFGLIAATNKVEDALTCGGIDYEVETFSIKPVLTGANEEPEADWVIPTFTGIRRCDDRKTVFAVLRDTYIPVQNRQILEFVTPLLEATEGEFTRVGSFDNGAQVFAVITLRETITLPNGKEVKQELFLTSSHNGAKCLEIKVVATLNNTIIHQSAAFGFRHTKNVHIRANEVAKIIRHKDDFFTNLGDKFAQLNGVAVSDVEASEWLKKFLDYPEQADVSAHPRKVATHDRLIDAFRKAVAGGNTRLALVLAVAYDRAWTAPVRNTKHFVSSAESRFKSSLNGTSAKELEAAWAELLKP